MTMRVALLAVILASSVAPAAMAQTTLHLSATASISAAPDQLVADLVAQSTSASAATAQRQVNDLIARGMQAAHAVATVTASATGYEVEPGPKEAGWVARQTLELTSTDGPALLDLTAKLQAAGFVTAALDWRLSPELRRGKQDEAMLAAIRRMQDEAAAAAAALGQHVDHMQDVRLEPTPVFGPRMMTAMAAPGAPQATATAQDVSATVSADVALRP